MRGISTSSSRLCGMAVALIALGNCGPALAQFDDGQQPVSQCILDRTGDTRSTLALMKIKYACNDLYQSNSMATDDERNYDMCVLNHITGAQSDYAAQQIANACRSTSSPF